MGGRQRSSYAPRDKTVMLITADVDTRPLAFRHPTSFAGRPRPAAEHRPADLFANRECEDQAKLKAQNDHAGHGQPMEAFHGTHSTPVERGHDIDRFGCRAQRAWHSDPTGETLASAERETDDRGSP